ncbi:MAG: type II toxin-antitoxin system RelE/ParE family toxin [Gammaproteobacteria bacterium]|nr:type II toxin-antitoxin system RelE/ParE family toxin [Gammaproteobacteria bacterium]
MPLSWLHGEIKTPPFSSATRLEAGFLLRRLQRGEKLRLPHSRPMPSVGVRCHERRINDAGNTWRIMYRIDEDAIVILEVFAKKTGKTPKKIIDICKQRLRHYDSE